MAGMTSSTANAVEGSARGGQQSVRPAAVAGSFYPADATALKNMMEDMLAHVQAPSAGGAICAMVAPHAGYPYSGPVAACAYAALKGQSFARVVVIAPSHREAFHFSSVYDGDGYATPLGTVPVDKAFAHELVKISPTIRFSEHGHAATERGAEHAIEVQLPWLQEVLGDFSLVPIVMGEQSYANSRALGLALAQLIAQEEDGSGATLIVASSDLSHYHSYEDAEQIDRNTLNALAAWDYLSMSRNFHGRVWEACGGAPIIAAMMAAEQMGATAARVLRYANSGDTAGDRSRVVGYSADVFVKATDMNGMEGQLVLSAEEKSMLLGLARKSVEHAVAQHSLFHPGKVQHAALGQERGAFVTLMEDGKLRGCIGSTSADEALYLRVRDTATLAALRDPRFKPVAENELGRLRYEISVLSPLRRVVHIQEITVGMHGLLIKKGDREGLLLPQVPVERHWDRTRFLQETCLKAGTAPESWKDADTDIFRFTAVVFGDRDTELNQSIQ